MWTGCDRLLLYFDYFNYLVNFNFAFSLIYDPVTFSKYFFFFIATEKQSLVTLQHILHVFIPPSAWFPQRRLQEVKEKKRKRYYSFILYICVSGYIQPVHLLFTLTRIGVVDQHRTLGNMPAWLYEFSTLSVSLTDNASDTLWIVKKVLCVLSILLCWSGWSPNCCCEARGGPSHCDSVSESATWQSWAWRGERPWEM